MKHKTLKCVKKGCNFYGDCLLVRPVTRRRKNIIQKPLIQQSSSHLKEKPVTWGNLA